MSSSTCPQCGEPLSLEAIDLAAGVAHCATCDASFPLAELVRKEMPLAHVIERTPDYCELISTSSGDTENLLVRARFYHPKALWISLGILSFASVIGLVIAYQSLQTFSGLGREGGLSGEVFSFFSIFFGLMGFLPVVINLVLGFVVLSFILKGKVEVELDAEQGEVRTGALGYARKSYFVLNAVRDVRLLNLKKKDNDLDLKQVVLDLESGEKIELGTLLPQERRQWLRAALQLALLEKHDHPLRQALVQQAKLES